MGSRQRRRGTSRILPMELRVGDRFSDEIGEWEVVGRPQTSAGENAHVRARLVVQPAVTETRLWGAHEHINLKRATAEEALRPFFPNASQICFH